MITRIKISKDKFLFIDGIFIVKLNNKKILQSNNEINLIKLLYENWLKQKCISLYESKLKQFSKGLDVVPKNFVIKNLKNRWGSLTKKNYCSEYSFNKST